MHDNTGNLDAFAFLGTWWLPEERDNRVSGALHFSSDDGVRLDLHAPLETGRFAHPQERRVKIGPPEFGRTFGPPLIHGIRDDGCHCTIFGAFRITEHLGGGSAQRVEYTGR